MSGGGGLSVGGRSSHSLDAVGVVFPCSFSESLWLVLLSLLLLRVVSRVGEVRVCRPEALFGVAFWRAMLWCMLSATERGEGTGGEGACGVVSVMGCGEVMWSGGGSFV